MRGLFTLSLVLYCAVWATAFIPSFSASRRNHRTMEEGTLPATADPSPCKTALQWEGRFSEWDHNAGTNNRYTISYDGVKRRKWVEEEQKSMRPGRRLFKFLILFDEQVEYKIDLTYNKCSKIQMGPWRNFSIPPLALYEDEYQIGGPKGNLDVIEWSDRQPARKRETWIGGFTKNGCWPVFEIFTYVNDSVSVAYTTRFFDLTPGIKNMSIFDVPELCKTATAEPPSDPSSAWIDEGLGLWNSWVPDWFKKWFAEQKIDLGGLVAPSEVPGSSTEVPGTKMATAEPQSDPSPEAPSPDEGMGVWDRWVPKWPKKWFPKQKPSDVPGPSAEVRGRPTPASQSDLPSRDRNRYNTFKGSKAKRETHWMGWMD